MPLVLGLLIIVLATLVLLLRASEMVADGRRPARSAGDWLSEAVEHDRDRGLALTGVTAQYR